MNRSGSGLCPDKSSFVHNEDVSWEGDGTCQAGISAKWCRDRLVHHRTATAQAATRLQRPPRGQAPPASLRGDRGRRVTDPRGTPSRPGPPKTGWCAGSIATRQLSAATAAPGRLLRCSHQSGLLKAAEKGLRSCQPSVPARSSALTSRSTAAICSSLPQPRSLSACNDTAVSSRAQRRPQHPTPARPAATRP